MSTDPYECDWEGIDCTGVPYDTDKNSKNLDIKDVIEQKISELAKLKEQENKIRTIYKDDYSERERCERKRDNENMCGSLPSSCIEKLQPIWSEIITLETEIKCLNKLKR